MRKSNNTVARRHILKLIQDSGKALSPQEIQACIDGLCDRVTIYRVLRRLEQEGFVHKLVNIDGVVRYANCIDRDNKNSHLHFSCIKCNTVTCLIDVEVRFELNDLYKVNKSNFVIQGVCASCNKIT